MNKYIYLSGHGKICLGLLSTFVFLFISFQSLAQKKSYVIKGKVIETGTNAPLPGVLVNITNTNFGTSTEGSGNFSLTANLTPGKYKIVFSLVGYKSQTKTLELGSSEQVSINGELGSDVTGLDEVIVTGTSIGTTRKQLGSYVSSVSSEQLNKGVATNALSALQGKTAGAQITQNSGDPAGGMSVRLRGISSVNSSSEPLYIVDGVIVNNSTTRVTNTTSNYDGGNFVGNIGQNRLVDINPADIERIEVLNGAAAAAIYGSRANAGVVQIFTKRGSAGAPVVGFSTSLTFSKLRKRIDVSHAPTKFGGSPDVQTQDILTPSLVNTTPVTRYDYQDAIFQTATGTDNNISVSGGKEDTKYYTSLSYFSNEGIVQNTDFKRFNFRANLDQKLAKWASLTAGLNYVNSNANEKPDGNSFFSPMNSVTIIGNFHDIYARDLSGNLKAVGERGRVNPLSVIEEIQQKEETNRVLGNLGIKVFPVKNLTIDYTAGVDTYSQNGTTFIPAYPYNVSDAFFGGGPTLDPARNGYSGKANNNVLQFNNEINGTYIIDINKDWGSTTQVGYSYQYEKGTYSLLQGRGLVPLVETVNGASTPIAGSDLRNELWISGGYLQQNFKYRDHLFVTGAIRVDGSSVFGKDERSQVYLKGNLSYILSSAQYWEKLGVSDWWDLFKLRIAYGESGNLTGIGAYDRFNGYNSQSYLGKSSLFSSTQLTNPQIKPERQQELEIGTDLSFMKNRIGVTFNWYKKRVNDLLFPTIIAPTTGFSSLQDNFGSLENKGYELVLNAVPVRNKDFAWNASFIFNHNRNKGYGLSQPLLLLSTNAGAPVAIIEGQPIGVFYGTYFATDASGNWILNANGIPLTERGIQNGPLDVTVQRDANGLPLSTATTLRKVIGDPNPNYTSSFINDFTYKKLSLRVQLDAVQGVDVFNADWRTRQGVGNGLVAEKEHEGLLPRGYIAGVYSIEEWRIDDGSFVKLREISLGYNFGKVKFFKDLNVNVSGRNLISWDNYKGYDPEVNGPGQSTVLRGIDFGSVPIPSTFSIGIQAKF
ncbi:SusC/RagA family TonB-linked outer membrane protein [Solitalea koreensis]|uniref:TonB-linked outer membrane protein, SusC/RagA family n=1 Tax=Solitalea koreensis TaxID=543615 RepID=A0A521APJ0_9SPHI|nr:SusC/RagA family TonB-linked outer membrane protein [Solitalea koreensis]SMO36744.1 TonB-linked outer membrane protein, SusC/RagA family [Solitalea koreensis]